MRILAFSDVRDWEGYEKLVDKVKPDVVALAGDVTSDGFAGFWMKGLAGTSKQSMQKWKRTHVNRFYQFLRYAGEQTRVLVVRGNHDEDFKGDYDPDRINKTSGCQEVSGKSAEIGGLRFLGLGFGETQHVRLLNALVTEFRGRIDVVLTHGERLPLISSLKPKLIIKGGFGRGKCLVNDVPTILTAGVYHTVVRFEYRKLSEISQYFIDRAGNTRIAKKFCPRSWFSRYHWAKPYPAQY